MYTNGKARSVQADAAVNDDIKHHTKHIQYNVHCLQNN